MICQQNLVAISHNLRHKLIIINSLKVINPFKVFQVIEDLQSNKLHDHVIADNNEKPAFAAMHGLHSLV